MGRIHVGKQDLGKLQIRKMKGLKRSREAEAGDEDVTMVDEGSGSEQKRPKSSP
jgi:ribosome production factor 2